MSTALDIAPYEIDQADYGYGEVYQDDIPPRLMALRLKIHDSSYLNNAIGRIASVISRNIVDNPEELHLNSGEGLYW